MRESDLERAFAEVLTSICNNDPIRNLLGNLWVGGAAMTGSAQIGQNSGWLMNMEGWWYITYRTPDGICATKIIEFFMTSWLKVQTSAAPPTYRDMNDAEKTAFFASHGTPGNPGVPEKVVREEFLKFMRSVPNWWTKSYGSVVAGDIGPWPTTGSGGD